MAETNVTEQHTPRDVLQDAASQKHEPICRHELYV